MNGAESWPSGPEHRKVTLWGTGHCRQNGKGLQGLNTAFSLIPKPTGRAMWVTGYSSLRYPCGPEDGEAGGPWSHMAVLKEGWCPWLATLPRGRRETCEYKMLVGCGC